MNSFRLFIAKFIVVLIISEDCKFVKCTNDAKFFDSEWFYNQLTNISLQIMEIKDDITQNVISDSIIILQYCYLIPEEYPDEEMLEDFKDINPRYSSEQILKLRNYLVTNHENISVEKEMRDEFWIKELNEVEYNMLARYYERLNLDPNNQMTLRYHYTILFRDFVNINNSANNKKKMKSWKAYCKIAKCTNHEKLINSDWLYNQLVNISLQLKAIKDDITQNVISDSTLILKYCYLMPGQNPDEKMLEDFNDITPRYSPEQILKLRSYLKNNYENNYENNFGEKDMRNEFWVTGLNELEYNMLTKYYKRLNLDPCDQMIFRYHYTILFRDFVNIKMHYIMS
ncbi:uncharacterized protein LOC126903563 [Daktulosphaira vitifoliae]|uniref:uncharacterized protein LOC126903563 n=1 Tax=Daktulosphaira vitifoliae TaxID=58002 RepID=UPI0021AAF88D|nr:uncharacterized protein LOC126903563 [Daktulosphaira vitifoliae]